MRRTTTTSETADQPAQFSDLVAFALMMHDPQQVVLAAGALARNGMRCFTFE